MQDTETQAGESTFLNKAVDQSIKSKILESQHKSCQKGNGTEGASRAKTKNKGILKYKN